MRPARRCARACSRACRISWQQHQPRFLDAAVPEPLGQPAASEQLTPGRHAGQRHLAERRITPRSAVESDHVRDGGQSGFSSTNDALRFNTFTGQANNANFQNGEPTKWVIISAPIFNSPEGAFFYPPVVADPHTGERRHDLPGLLQRVAHTGLGRQSGVPRSELPGVHDRRPAKPAAETSFQSDRPGATDLTDTFAVHYGADRRGSAVAWIQRTPSNTGTAWVATGAGRVFISETPTRRRPRSVAPRGYGDRQQSRRAISARSRSIPRTRTTGGSRTRATT